MTEYARPQSLASQMQFGVPQQVAPQMQFPSYALDLGGSLGGVNGAMSQFGQNFQGQNQAFNPMGMLGGGMDTKAMPTWGLGGQTPSTGIMGAMKDAGMGFNMPTLQLGMQGLGALSSLWMGNKSLNLAKDQFNFTKDVTNTNLNNQIKSYNSTLEDRTKRASEFNGTSKEDAQAEYERRKLAR